MSNVSNIHDIKPFVSGKSEPLTDQRLARISFKQTEKMTKAGIKALPSVCVSVPPVSVEDVQANIEQFMPHLVALVERTQDDVIRSLVESSGGTRTTVSDDEISIPAVLAYLSAESAGARLSTESIGAWFDSALSDAVTVLIADKLGFDLSTPEQIATVTKHVKNHKDVLCMLAGKNVVLAPRQEQAIRNMLELTDEADTMHGRLMAKLTALCAAKMEELLI
jgi:hypothetical protein